MDGAIDRLRRRQEDLRRQARLAIAPIAEGASEKSESSPVASVPSTSLDAEVTDAGRAPSSESSIATLPPPTEAERPWTDERPRNYFEDCVGRPRPCPWIGCKFNLLLDIKENGTIIVNAGRTTVLAEKVDGVRQRPIELTRRVNVIPLKALSIKRFHKEDSYYAQQIDRGEEAIFTALHSAVWTEAPTCLLDLAEQGGMTLEATGDILNITRERVRQLEVKALAKLNSEAGEELRQAAREMPEERSNFGPDAWDRSGF